MAKAGMMIPPDVILEFASIPNSKEPFAMSHFSEKEGGG
jgi:hypothetical protein